MILTVNGIRKSAPTTTDTMGRMLDIRHGIHVVKLLYPTRRGWDAWNRASQYQDAKRMLWQIKHAIEARTKISGPEPVDIIGHSYGCLLTGRMMEMGGSKLFRNVFLFAPAMDTDWEFPIDFADTFKRLWVIHHKKDRAIRSAGFLPFSRWGKMGKDGYQGHDIRVKNIEDKTPQRGLSRMHSHYFQRGNVEKYVEDINLIHSGHLNKAKIFTT